MSKELDRRDNLLLKMYDQMFNDINRHIIVIWQSIGVIFVALGGFSLLEKKVLPLDYIITIIIIVCFWALYMILDSAYWYNRNLVIIANIERQFLKVSDLRQIHYYFGKHRKDNKMLTHLSLQAHLSLVVIVVVILYHFSHVICPIINNNYPCHIQYPLVLIKKLQNHYEKLIPYIALIVLSVKYILTKIQRDKSYKEFIENSPGIDINTTGVRYGVGHPSSQNN